MRNAYGLRPQYVTTRDASTGALLGILPLVEFRGLLGDRALISMPFLDVAGPLSAGPEIEAGAEQFACELAGRAGFRAVEMRVARPGSPGHRVNLAMSLEPDTDAQWRRLGAKVRNQTRKAEREGLTIALGDTQSLLQGFYEPYTTNMRDLGSPAHSRAFFEQTALAFGDRLRFVVTTLAGRPVGGLVAIHFGNAVYVPWASTLRSERARCPNNLIYWEAIRWAIERGAQRFDFGRSPPGSGTHRFKVGWGGVEEPLNWARRTPAGAETPPGARESDSLRRLTSLYARLPLRVANRLGPALRRYLSN